MRSFARRGVYILVIEAHGQTHVGRLGPQSFDGIYLYVGSALGPRGFQRVERHRAVAQGRNTTRRWHIDYLLGIGQLKGALLFETSEKAMECALAEALARVAQPVIAGFGASDCRCQTHLFRL
ncbi:MAG: GIY-YIG nuclease family protein [Candidatus Bipolaricaulota bacterium]|nr:GIY-YIG nuclease family protein [Candidatus Bipolaricaulota bacterium]MDW8031094.1 GIY-YIG nuclease family protein [Candidatus Bipolaricaulota bacterium]